VIADLYRLLTEIAKAQWTPVTYRDPTKRIKLIACQIRGRLMQAIRIEENSHRTHKTKLSARCVVMRTSVSKHIFNSSFNAYV